MDGGARFSLRFSQFFSESSDCSRDVGVCKQPGNDDYPICPRLQYGEQCVPIDAADTEDREIFPVAVAVRLRCLPGQWPVFPVWYPWGTRAQTRYSPPALHMHPGPVQDYAWTVL